MRSSHLNIAVVCAISLAARLPPAAHAQSTPPLEGLWTATNRFGPDIRGRLLVENRNGTWRAEIAGQVATAHARGDTITFSLADSAGSFIGYRQSNGRTITGHWIQERSIISGTTYASPVTLTHDEQGRWSGAVVPLDVRMTIQLLIRSRPDGTLGTFIRNPERNLGRQLRADHIERAGNDVRLLGRINGSGPEVVLASGTMHDDTFSLFFNGRGGTFDFHRVDAAEASDFYPRGYPRASYVYTAPPPLHDGWDVASLDDVNLSRDTIARFMQKLVDMPMDSLAAQQVHAVLITRHGKLVLEEYFHGESRDHPHDTRSAAKSYTSTLVGAAMQAGMHVSLATPVFAAMNGGQFANGLEPRKRAITLEHLLRMSSGLDCDDANPDSPGNENNLLDQSEQPDYYRYIMSLGTIREPGAKAVYCGINPHLAGGVLQRATGHSLPDLFHDLIAEPLGMQQYYLPLSPTGDAYMGGGIRVTAREFAKLGQLYLDGGTWRGHRILSKAFAGSVGVPRYEMAGIHYGLLWWVIDYQRNGRPLRAFFAGGNGGQVTMAIPGEDMVVTMFAANYADPVMYDLQRKYVPEFILPAVR